MWRIAIILLLPTFGFGQAPDIQKGLALFQHGEYEAALRDFEAAAKSQPGNPPLENIIGLADSKLGRWNDANIHYQNAIRLNPKLPAPHKNLGFNYLNAKQYDAAETELKTAVSLDPADQFAHYYLGMVFLATARGEQAIDQLRGVQPLLDNDPGTAFQFVMAAFRADQSAAAQASLAKLEQHSPLSAQQQYQLAVLFSEKRMFAKALDRFTLLAASDRHSLALQFDLAVANLNARRPLEAIRILNRLHAEHPQDAHVLALLGLAYEAAGQSLQALEAYRRALDAARLDPDRYLDYTRLLMDGNRLDDAAHVVTKGMTLVPDKYPLYIRRGSIDLLQGKAGEARQSFTEAVALHPELALGYVAMAKSYLKEGSDAEAAKILGDARTKLPPDFMLDYFYGLTLVRLQRSSEAAAVLQDAVRLDPNLPEPHYELGRAYLAMRRVDQARAEFERVLQLAPQDANAHYQLSRVYARLGETKKAREMADETKHLKQTQLDEAIEIQTTRLKSFQPASPAMKQ